MSTPPITYEFRLHATPGEAFDAYAGRIAEWWDGRYTANPDTLESVAIEPCMGGRVYATHSDLGEHDWGEVTVWEPGQRLVHTFSLAQDPRHPTEVAVEFVPDGGGCTVRFAHGGWNDENRGAREKFGDWPVMLDRFAALADASSKDRRVGWSEWTRGAEIEPSIYAADFSRLGEQLETLLASGARIFHFDIGDGHFVPPVTIGPIVLQWISPIVHASGGRMDCHLMTEHPDRHFEAIAQAGGDSVTFHYEAVEDVAAVAEKARDLDLGVGLVFNPETEPEGVAAVAQPFDLVLCMSINPGYSGQAFMPEALGRIERLRALLPDEQHIQVDGGVGPGNVEQLRRAGAGLLVAGTSVFGQDDIAQGYKSLAALL